MFLKRLLLFFVCFGFLGACELNIVFSGNEANAINNSTQNPAPSVSELKLCPAVENGFEVRFAVLLDKLRVEKDGETIFSNCENPEFPVPVLARNTPNSLNIYLDNDVLSVQAFSSPQAVMGRYQFFLCDGNMLIAQDQVLEGDFGGPVGSGFCPTGQMAIVDKAPEFVVPAPIPSPVGADTATGN